MLPLPVNGNSTILFLAISASVPAAAWSRDHKPGPEVWARVNRITLLHLIEVILVDGLCLKALFYPQMFDLFAILLLL